MTEIKQNIQSINTNNPINVNNQLLANKSAQQQSNVQINTPNDMIFLNPAIKNENPYIQNPFYLANLQQNIQQNPQYNQAIGLPFNYNQPFINEASFIPYNTVNSKGNLWKYLLVGGLGLFTGMALGSLMNYGSYFYYPMYYSYYYSPWWYNCGYGYGWGWW